jgi:spermidine synthase/Na+-translocating ferredoxin:NAD+ oxidoreductase RnfG subunit
MKFARAFLIFCYGLFTIAAQTLLFREFITAFEGNDISVGLFFASWLVWIGLGTAAAYRRSKTTAWLLENIDLLFLAYIPAFVLELILIIQARQIATVSPYTLLSVYQMVLLSLLVNAPVSLITGIFFPLACRWIQQDSSLAVSKVYILESAGSFLGGIGTTVLLSFGVNSITIFFLLTFIISFAVFTISTNEKIKLTFSSLIAACILAGLFAGIDKRLNRYIHIVKWTKLLPAQALEGSFQTAQAEYLYGTYHNQWVVVSQTGTCETMPDKAGTSRIAATVLSQKPDAGKILVIGSGLSLCYEFLLLPQIEQVTWTHCDNQYIQQVDKFLPAHFKTGDRRLSRPARDIRSQLAGLKNFYDIVIINLPDATSSVLNRYFTVEFYEQLKKSMSANGIAAIRVTGGENIMGTELIDSGASTKRTLEKVFSYLILTAGDDTWFIASDSENLTGNPGVLQDRFAKIKNAEAILEPSALLSIYLPDRAAAAIENYNSSDLPQHLLINTDPRPLASLYSLLFTLKQSGAPITKTVKLLALAGVFIFLIPVFVFVILRLFYIARTKNQNCVSSFDSSFLVFSAGWLGIGTVIMLMYLYQTMFGSLYLYIGAISSLFMIGLTTGAVLLRYLPGSLHQKLLIVILIHAMLLIAIVHLPVDFWTHQSFAEVFFLCGLCSGTYFPIAAGQLAESGFETGLAGAKLEMADHIGASMGSLLTGLVLVPTLGTKGTITVFLALILANIPPVLFKTFKKTALISPALDFRKVGYILFGIAASVIICSNLLTLESAHFSTSLPQCTAQMLAGQSQIEPAKSALSDSTGKIIYFKVYETEKNLSGYIFSTQDWAPDVHGFGGKINLAVYVDTTGKLINFHIIRSEESPSYLATLPEWSQKLKGHQLFQSTPFSDIDSITGATVSSHAIVSAIELASKKFASDILSQNISVSAAKKNFLPDRSRLYLLIAAVFSLLVIYKGNFWSRLAVLVFNLVIGGFILNAQYSSEQIITLLSGRINTFESSGVFLLIAAVPLLVLLFGNIYCGYLCPFGAAQELLSYIIPDRFKKTAPYEKMRKARFIKYIILFIMIIVFFISRSKQTLTPDPLITAFNLHAWHISFKSAVFIIMIPAVVGSIFYGRFWCRYLCPAGAFLSLFNNLIVLKRLVPTKSFARCEFGLTAKDNMDCIYCDRCRYQLKSCSPKLTTEYLFNGPAKYLLLSVLIIGVFISAIYIDKFLNTFPSPTVSATSISSAGQPRNVDLQRIRTMIEEKKLSDHEANFYQKSQ